jgi:cytochrome c553
MIRGLIFLGLWAASPTPGQVGSAALYTEFEKRPAPAVVQAIREETDSLMASNGLRFQWKSLPAADQSVWMELAVVKFSGRCEVLPFATNSLVDRRLGWTHISDGVVLPFAEVDCDAIGAYVRKDLLGLPAQSREKAFGRAVGRVTAHELLHVFAKTATHSSHGVDHPTLSVADLLADRMEFDELEPAVHMVRMNPQSVFRTARGSAEAGQDSYVHAGCASCHGEHGEGTPHGPVLRVSGRFLNSVILAAKLTKSQDKMCQRARTLKVASPSVAEDEIPDLALFLNEVLDQ